MKFASAFKSCPLEVRLYDKFGESVIRFPEDVRIFTPGENTGSLSKVKRPRIIPNPAYVTLI